MKVIEGFLGTGFGNGSGFGEREFCTDVAIYHLSESIFFAFEKSSKFQR